MAQHHPTGFETSPSYAPQSSRFGSEPPSVEDDVDVWHSSLVSCMPETTTTTYQRIQRIRGFRGDALYKLMIDIDMFTICVD